MKVEQSFNRNLHLLYFQGMEELVDAGFVENIGLSNFNKSQIERILLNSRIKPCNIQVNMRLLLSVQRFTQERRNWRKTE